jgi:hypothetical protein
MNPAWIALALLIAFGLLLVAGRRPPRWKRAVDRALSDPITSRLADFDTDDALTLANPYHRPRVERGAHCLPDCWLATCPCGWTTGHASLPSALAARREHRDAAELSVSPSLRAAVGDELARRREGRTP